MADLLSAIQSISDEARRALADPEMGRDELLSVISVRKLLLDSRFFIFNTL